MRDIINKLQVLRTSKLYDKFQFQDDESDSFCRVRNVTSGVRIIFFLNGCSIWISNSLLQVYRLPQGNGTVTFQVPYNVQDKNEFFQLSTIHDYRYITYDDLVKLKDLCDFMINRELHERKKI